MKDFFVRRPALSWMLLLGLIWAGFSWLSSGTPEAKPTVARPTQPVNSATPNVTRSAGAPRSAKGLVLSDQTDISVDARPTDARRQNISREFFETVQELKFMHPQVFDGATQRWAEDPKVKAIRAEWKEIEAGWTTQDEAAKAAVVPRMEAMWKEAQDLLRAEVEKSAREANAGVK
jgi:hypothetical protein